MRLHQSVDCVRRVTFRGRPPSLPFVTNETARIGLSGLILAGLFLAACDREGAGAGCKQDAECKGGRRCIDDRCQSNLEAKPLTAATTVPSVAATARAVESARAPAFDAAMVDAGKVLGSGAWLPKFAIRRRDGQGAVPFLQAFESCRVNQQALCTEAQWTRACEANANVGALETWTATAAGQEGFVVRGGGGCGARRVASGSAAAPRDAGVCCERAVAIDSATSNPAFLISTSQRMRDYERAHNSHDASALRPQLAARVQFLGKEWEREALLREGERFFRQYPDQWLLFEQCMTTTGSEPDAQGGVFVYWKADCRVLMQRSGKVALVNQRYFRDGASGEVARIEESSALLRPYSEP